LQTIPCTGTDCEQHVCRNFEHEVVVFLLICTEFVYQLLHAVTAYVVNTEFFLTLPPRRGPVRRRTERLYHRVNQRSPTAANNGQPTCA
jgi:hypothetical protein